MNEVDVGLVNEYTKIFFDTHWKEEKSGLRPAWKESKWNETLINQEKQGCYTFYNKDNNLFYIGVGASEGSGIYKGCGLGNRIYRNYYASIKTWALKKGWEDVFYIRTIAFDIKTAYLAYALEVYLVNSLSDKKIGLRNVVGRRYPPT